MEEVVEMMMVLNLVLRGAIAPFMDGDTDPESTGTLAAIDGPKSAHPPSRGKGKGCSSHGRRPARGG